MGESKKDRQHNGQKKKDKQQSTKHTQNLSSYWKKRECLENCIMIEDKQNKHIVFSRHSTCTSIYVIVKIENG
jgi:hypothetical protein